MTLKNKEKKRMMMLKMKEEEEEEREDELNMVLSNSDHHPLSFTLRITLILL